MRCEAEAIRYRETLANHSFPEYFTIADNTAKAENQLIGYIPGLAA
jgi:hypothetical protein